MIEQKHVEYSKKIKFDSALKIYVDSIEDKEQVSVSNYLMSLFQEKNELIQVLESTLRENWFKLFYPKVDDMSGFQKELAQKYSSINDELKN